MYYCLVTRRLLSGLYKVALIIRLIQSMSNATKCKGDDGKNAFYGISSLYHPTNPFVLA